MPPPDMTVRAGIDYTSNFRRCNRFAEILRELMFSVLEGPSKDKFFVCAGLYTAGYITDCAPELPRVLEEK
jgi:hypothetical protein